MNIVWIEPPGFSAGMRKLAQKYLVKKGFNTYDIQFVTLTKGCLRKRTKTQWEADSEKEPEFIKALSALKPSFIICNDKAALNYITGKYLSLAKCRGSIYNWHGIPCLVVNEIKQINYVDSASWFLLQDLGKAKRWTTGRLREEPRFSYTVCHSFSDVQDLQQAAKQSVMIGIDIETTAIVISSIQYTCVYKHNGRLKMHTWVVPFVNPLKPKGVHWETVDLELQVWFIIRCIHQTEAVKCMQNGSYDSAYFLKYRVPLKNYIADTMHGWHSVWAELQKRLDLISSVALDKYVYWKDEGKIEDDSEDTKGGAIPKTKEGLDHYWLYGALDSHNTVLSFRFILAVLVQKKMAWGLDNYKKEMRQQFGPALSMTMRGVNCNRELHSKYLLELQDKSDQALAELKYAIDPEFNPNSPIQVKRVLYTVLQTKPYGRGKQRTSTDEKVLTMIKDQNVFINWFVETLWRCKKPANNVSKYGHKAISKGRFMYKMCAGVTDTMRYASRGHDFWCGTNAQNVPYLMRQMLEADDGYVLFDIDYAQSDAYFTAFESEDEKFIKNMIGPDDVHCLHCEFFFKQPYNKLYEGHKKKEDWVSHNVTGVRSITKRVVYGANYLMRGATLLLTMSREPVQAAAKFLRIPKWNLLTDKQLTKLCDAFLAKYFQMYPRLKEWLYDEAIPQAAANGNKATCAFGGTRIFFGKLSDDKTQRKFAAYFGQGGTAGNINKALDNIYFGMSAKEIEARTEDAEKRRVLRNLQREGVQLLFQVHDSIIGQIPKDRLDLIPAIELAMANPVTIKGRTFTVPTDAQVGIGWGKRLMNYKDGITYEDIKAHDDEWWEKLK